MKDSISIGEEVNLTTNYHLHHEKDIDDILSMFDIDDSDFGTIQNIVMNGPHYRYTVVDKTYRPTKPEIAYLISDDKERLYVVTEKIVKLYVDIPDATSRGIALTLECPHCRCTNYVEERDSENNTECIVCNKTFHIPDGLPVTLLKLKKEN